MYFQKFTSKNTQLMKKFSLPLIAGLAILASCAKQDIKPQAQDPIEDAQSSVTMERHCASAEVLEKQIAENPARGKFLEDLERFTEAYRGRGESRGPGILYVP